jgi:hypothetical protein
MTLSQDSPARGRRRLRTAAKILLGTVVGLAVAEGAFWLRDGGAFPHLNVYVPDDALGVRLRAGAAQRVSFGGNPITHVRINARGLRGPELPGPAKGEVIVVGDSQVFGLGVEEDQAFPAVLAEKLSRPVVNAGVPTFGPLEYGALTEELLRERKASTVVYVVHLANDLFEADRPNTERHKVWDGWAVRAETAPASYWRFPGRELLLRRSHAIFALRKLYYDRVQRKPEPDDKGFASEGTYRDIVGAAEGATEVHAANERERVRKARFWHDEVAFAQRRAIAAQLSFEQLVATTFGNAQGQIVRAARANPGDIVAPAPGEEARPLLATAIQIKEGAALRAKYEAELRKLAEKAAGEIADAERAKTIRERLAARDETAKRLAELEAAPLSIVREQMPIAKRIAEVKKTCDAHGAELLVVALPLDVMVSPEEWKKYGSTPVDMESTKVLLSDVVAAAEEAGARGLDATAALAAAEPGAFLNRDLHMTPKGHVALAEAIAAALAKPPAPRRAAGLALGRSRAPRPEDWATEKETTVTGSTNAGCETKRVREWLRVTCRKKGAAGATPIGVAILRGGHDDAMGATWDSATTLVAPVLPGDRLEADFFWTDRVQRLVYEWPADAPVPLTALFEAERPAGTPPPAATEAEALCACHKKETGAATCADLVAAPDKDCARTYPASCGDLLACSAGDWASPPRCAPGHAPAGATGRCRPLCVNDVDCEKSAAGGGSTALAATDANAGAQGSTPAKATEPLAPLATPEAERALGAAMAASTTYAKTCRLLVDLWDEIVYDTCRPRGEERDALLAAHRALVEHTDKNPGSTRGSAATLAEAAILFGSWVEEATRSKLDEYQFKEGQIRALNGLDKTGATRGTLALYQRVARAWNAYRPAEPLALDPVRTYLQGYFNERPVESLTSWFYGGVGQDQVKKGGALRWLRCLDGPCLLGY